MNFPEVFALFVFDTNAPFVSWTITNRRGEVVVEAALGTYSTAHATEQFFLQVGETYIFTIRDAFADGITGTSTGYTFVLADYLPPVVILQGDGNFGESRIESFYIPHEGEGLSEQPSMTPSIFPSPQTSLTPSFKPSSVLSAGPSQNPSMASAPTVETCRIGGEGCQAHSECCSERCFFSRCRGTTSSQKYKRASLQKDSTRDTLGEAKKNRGGLRRYR